MWTSGRDSGHPLWCGGRPAWWGCCGPPPAPGFLMVWHWPYSSCSSCSCTGMQCPPAAHIWRTWARPPQVVLYVPSCPWSMWFAKKITLWKTSRGRNTGPIKGTAELWNEWVNSSWNSLSSSAGCAFLFTFDSVFLTPWGQVAQTLLFCMEAMRGLAESDTPELLREDHAFCWDVPIWTVSLNVSYWESGGTAAEKHSGLALPCRVVLETVKHAKCKKKKKKGILPKGNYFCQTMSYQIPSRWNFCFESTLCAPRNHVTEQEALTLEEVERFAWLLCACWRPELTLLLMGMQSSRQYNDRFENRHGMKALKGSVLLGEVWFLSNWNRGT